MNTPESNQKLQTNRFVDFKYIYTQSLIMISHPFRIGLAQVNTVIVEYTVRLQKFSNSPRILKGLS